MEFLINQVLNAMGYSKEQFDAILQQAGNELKIFKARAENSERAILSLVDKIDALEKKLESTIKSVETET